MKPNLMVIRSNDIDALADFYTGLGCQFTKHRHGKGPEHYAQETDDFVFEIYPRSDENDSTCSVRIGFAVTSVDDAVAKVQASARGRIVSEPKDSPWGRRAVIDDPEGHRVELIEKKA